MDLLREISDLCGSVVTANNNTRKLISVSELQRLDKEKGEALIMHARQYPIITEMADIDDYECFKGFKKVELEAFELPEVSVFSVRKLIKEIRFGLAECPFGKPGAELPAYSSDEEDKANNDDEF